MYYFSDSAVGFDFVFGLPVGPRGLFPQFELCILTLYDEANFTIEVSNGTVIREGSTSSSNPVRLILPGDLEVTSSDIAQRMKGIRVRATRPNPISVLSNVVYPSISIYGRASYLIHINSVVENQSSYEYFALSTDYDGNPLINDRKSTLLLVGNFNGTTVSITPTQNVSLPQNTQENSSLIHIAVGSTHQVTLDGLQTLLITTLSDLTGTRIVSSQPLTVITGHQCAQVPATQAFCAPLFVHIPPTVQWGQEFFLGPFAGRNSSLFYKLVTSKNSTTITYRCGDSSSQIAVITGAGNSSLLELPSNSFCYLTATSPIFAVQLGTGHTVDNVGDPAIAIVPPTIGHVNMARFISVLANNFITITVQAEHYNPSDILLDGNPLVCNWYSIYDFNSCGIVGYGCTANVSEGTHTVMHSREDGVLSTIAYGWSISPALGYAYLTGITWEGKFSGKASSTQLRAV